MDFYFSGEVSVLTWAHPVAAVLDMGEKNGKYRHRVLFSSEKVWTFKKMDFTIQFIKMNTKAELKSVKSCPCRIGGDQAINALNANGIHDQDNLGHWSDQYPQDEEPEPPITEAPITETEAPVTETEAPITETEAPITETEPPITETKAPVTETEPPITETDAPITETEAPVTETEQSITETEEPQIPKIVKTMKSNIVVAIDTPFPFTSRVYLFLSQFLCFILHKFYYFVISNSACQYNLIHII